MSKLYDLINKLCSDGVEYVDLKNVCYITKGVQFNKKNMNETGSFPVINGGINPSGYIEQYNQEKETITISQGGASAGYVNFINSKFWAGAHCYIIKPEECVLNRYLYHFLKSKEHQLQECQYGAGIPALAKSTVANLKIPFPPLEVQREIVRVLDNFTELTQELTQELTLRKKQYSYYRDYLLDFGDDVEYKALNEITTLSRGVRVVRNQLETTGTIPVYQNSLTPLGYYTKNNCKANTTFIIGAGNAGEIGFSYVDFWSADDCYYFICSEKILDRFLYYALLCKYDFIKLQVRKASIPRISRNVIEKIKIPVPPIEEQERIVKILDKFDTLCNDLTTGIPAEIALRKKQYEYYRDKLLSFEELRK
ncbi:MAG: restriction endonuclease subunit S [Ruminococcus sp.]|nr:restriction endonuclease subunit S [Ruminococcus sp.]